MLRDGNHSKSADGRPGGRGLVNAIPEDDGSCVVLQKTVFLACDVEKRSFVWSCQRHLEDAGAAGLACSGARGAEWPWKRPAWNALLQDMCGSTTLKVVKDE